MGTVTYLIQSHQMSKEIREWWRSAPERDRAPAYRLYELRDLLVEHGVIKKGTALNTLAAALEAAGWGATTVWRPREGVPDDPTIPYHRRRKLVRVWLAPKSGHRGGAVVRKNGIRWRWAS